MIGNFVRIKLIRNIQTDALTPMLSASAAHVQSLPSIALPYRKKAATSHNETQIKSSPQVTRFAIYNDDLRKSMSKYRLVRLQTGQELTENITKILIGATPQTRLGTSVSFLAWYLLRENVTQEEDIKKHDVVLHSNFPSSLQSEFSIIKHRTKNGELYNTLSDGFTSATSIVFTVKQGRAPLYQSLADAYIRFNGLLNEANKYTDTELDLSDEILMTKSLVKTVREWCIPMINMIKKILTADWNNFDFAKEVVGVSTEESEMFRKSGLLSLAADLKTYLSLVESFTVQLAANRKFSSHLTDSYTDLSHFDFIDFTELHRLLSEYDKFTGPDTDSDELVDLVDTSRFICKLVQSLNHGVWFRGEEKGPEGGPEMIESVESLLAKVPSNLVNDKILSTVRDIDVESSNKSVDRALYKSITSGRVSIQLLEGQQINISDIEAAILLASQVYEKLNERSRKLLNMARLIFRLRQGVLLRDWEAVERTLRTKPPKVQKEIEQEVQEIIQICKEAQDVRNSILDTLCENKVCGRPDRLDLSSVNISRLLIAVRKFENTHIFGSFSNFDRKLKYSVNILKSLRSSLLLSDFIELNETLQSLQITEIVDSALEEVEVRQLNHCFP